LRAIPNKIIGVFFLLMRILMFLIFVFFDNYYLSLDLINKFLLIFLLIIFIFLTFLGGAPLEIPFLFLGIY
jgi:cytochrome b/b6/petD-like protein